MGNEIVVKEAAKTEAKQAVKGPPKAKHQSKGNNCPGGHGLTEFTTDQDGYGCDNCGSTKIKGNVMFGCRRCNYDLCFTCNQEEHVMGVSRYGQVGDGGRNKNASAVCGSKWDDKNASAMNYK
eukprot:303212_1